MLGRLTFLTACMNVFVYSVWFRPYYGGCQFWCVDIWNSRAPTSVLRMIWRMTSAVHQFYFAGLTLRCWGNCLNTHVGPSWWTRSRCVFVVQSWLFEVIPTFCSVNFSLQNLLKDRASFFCTNCYIMFYSPFYFSSTLDAGKATSRRRDARTNGKSVCANSHERTAGRVSEG